jgi:hypothetical protein
MADLVVRRNHDGSEVHRIEVTGKSDRSIERIMLGMLHQMDTDKHYIDDSEIDGCDAVPVEEMN